MDQVCNSRNYFQISKIPKATLGEIAMDLCEHQHRNWVIFIAMLYVLSAKCTHKLTKSWKLACTRFGILEEVVQQWTPAPTVIPHHPHDNKHTGKLHRWQIIISSKKILWGLWGAVGLLPGPPLASDRLCCYQKWFSRLPERERDGRQLHCWKFWSFPVVIVSWAPEQSNSRATITSNQVWFTSPTLWQSHKV